MPTLFAAGSTTLMALAGAVLAAGVLAGGPGPVHAQADGGGCRATIDGVDASTARSAGSAIEVDADANVFVVVDAPGPITGYSVDLGFGPFGFRASEGTVSGNETSTTMTVDVSSYARYGVGLYRVDARTTGTVCDEIIWVKVTGRNPLTTVAGVGGALFAGAGLAGLLAGFVRAGGAAAGATTTTLGAIAGIIAGLGVAVLLQQFAVLPLGMVTMAVPTLGLGATGLGLAWPRGP